MMAKKKMMTDAELEAERYRESGKFQSAGAVTPGPTILPVNPITDYAEEPADINVAEDVAKFAEAGTPGLAPGVLKKGFTEGPLPPELQTKYGSPDILGWRYVVGPDGLTYVEAQTAAGSTSTFGAPVNAPSTPQGTIPAPTTTTPKTAEQIAAEANAAANKASRQSAYDLLYSQFKQYGLESLVEGIKGLIQKDVSPSQFTIELRNSPEYQKRFAANALRIKSGYKALDEATYLALEDSYQNLMRNYGLPNSYWQKGEMGVQPGFEKLIAGNVDPVELEQRLIQAVDQIEKGPKEYVQAIKDFYPEISRSDLLSYVLDPTNALKAIQAKVKAAQIGGEYARAGIGATTGVARAEELARQGVTAEMARANIPTIMEAAKRGGELAGYYQAAGIGPYDQATAEEEIYNLGKAAEAKKKRQQYTALEEASFAKKSGIAQGALARDRAGAY